MVRFYKEQVELFKVDRKSPYLEDHALSGKLQGFSSFSITGDIRVVYLERSKDHFVFIDIGTHTQVYGK
ncbi:hypothetical protein A2803_02530 [Candidatus Woesebacteria bacterium RIFCSPHIGHO2_01_FULL_44_21]|uniref:Type II toxin-antitoxin system mRNA interferase toxin, RelE/StbE family n=1 Tax=Candidatus Woesebacteria bacterium RIFCSPHIGHO2_01_FULL_44_21 TaxID=1802503 RepID=A0A1F7YY18_9BACT|nr:MAG: hypothetical protein A2803_02530 [Candidatus Woesebacteria bacterium RIFCSPHIGHO2_01_FULL_44_21]OGM70460.1 MAG: hypothetical protein A2897_01715 [Candidatus Woesebacteria bacterium RIFCSPLOWO2_01_FULL_44_24b]